MKMEKKDNQYIFIDNNGKEFKFRTDITVGEFLDLGEQKPIEEGGKGNIKWNMQFVAAHAIKPKLTLEDVHRLDKSFYSNIFKVLNTAEDFQLPES